MIKKNFRMNSHRECGRMALVLMLFVAPMWAWAQTEITSLSDIDASNGNYIITADINGGAPGVSTFTGTLTARAKADGTFPVISGLTILCSQRSLTPPSAISC